MFVRHRLQFVDWSVCLSFIGCKTDVAGDLVDDVVGEV